MGGWMGTGLHPNTIASGHSLCLYFSMTRKPLSYSLKESRKPTLKEFMLLFLFYLLSFLLCLIFPLTLSLITDICRNTGSNWYSISFSPSQTNKTNSVAISPRANYTNWSTATCWRNLLSTFVDRGVSRGQRGGSPTVVNLSFLDRSRYFSFK
jgi:hypothetical protein